MKNQRTQPAPISFQSTPDGSYRSKGAISRRRAILLFGCAAGLPALGSNNTFGANEGVSLYNWEGSALGAQAKLTLAHHNQEEAKNIISSAVQEIERLERIFSLHRSTSELTVLNSQGYISQPSMDLVNVLKSAIRFGHDTGGAFDITVQPLWKIYVKTVKDLFIMLLQIIRIYLITENYHGRNYY